MPLPLNSEQNRPFPVQLVVVEMDDILFGWVVKFIAVMFSI